MQTAKDLLQSQIDYIRREIKNSTDAINDYADRIEEERKNVDFNMKRLEDITNAITILEKSASEQIQTKKQKRDRTP